MANETEKSVEKCVYHKSNGNEFCKVTIYEVCDPQNCPFYQSREDKEASREQARQNFIKRFRFDGYGKVPYVGDGQWIGQVLEFRKKHVKECDLIGREKDDD